MIDIVSYEDLLKHPKWKEKRQEIIERDSSCVICGGYAVLSCHHLIYKTQAKPWEYDNKDLIMLCGLCHHLAHKYLKRNGREKFLILLNMFQTVDSKSHDYWSLMGELMNG